MNSYNNIERKCRKILTQVKVLTQSKEETRKAQEAISTLLAMLSNYYIEDKKGEFYGKQTL